MSVGQASSATKQLEAIARRFHEHEADDPPAEIAALIHPDARMTLLISHLRVLDGRQAIMAALAQEREAFVYRADVESCEWLDDVTVLVCGKARYLEERGGVTSAQVWWRDEFLDDLLWRVTAYSSEVAAREGL